MTRQGLLETSDGSVLLPVLQFDPCDARGNVVPLARQLIHFDVSGPARLIGVDNGDPESHASYQGNERALFNGLALALVQSTRQPGSLRVTARASGLREASIEIIARPSP